ncbi:MAG: cobalamin-binding protein [Lachnospiraceae bacterium]|nr:cobalamin-binding protein [Lachnospiraceae bacterium]
MFTPDFAKLAEDMGDLREDAVLSAVRKIAKETPELAQPTIDALCSGMNIVGELFEQSEYFVGDLIYAGELFSESFDLLTPLFNAKEDSGLSNRKVILATVEGDFHDIGKNIVKVVMQSKGLKVIDLGVNVPPSVILKAAQEENACAVALSAVLTSAIDAMMQTIDLFKKAGIRDKVTIIVGGACMNKTTAQRIGADAFGYTPEESARICYDACQRSVN